MVQSKKVLKNFDKKYQYLIWPTLCPIGLKTVSFDRFTWPLYPAPKALLAGLKKMVFPFLKLEKMFYWPFKFHNWAFIFFLIKNATVIIDKYVWHGKRINFSLNIFPQKSKKKLIAQTNSNGYLKIFQN